MTWQQRLVDICEEHPHPAWGPAHVRSVLALSTELASTEGLDVDTDALFAAAYLHDLGAHAPYSVEGEDHAEVSVKVARDILADTDFPAEQIPLVAEIIAGHMFYAEPGSSAEARVFHDADVLEFLGAIGCARMISVVGIDDWTPDLPTAVGLLRQFAEELPESLVTDTAIKMAK